MKLQTIFLLLALGFLFALELTAQDRLQLHTRDGNLIHTTVDSQILTIADLTDAEPRQLKVPWSEIESLQLVEYQLSQQSVRVEELLDQLTDPDYEKREQAEELLRDADKFGPFESLIRNAELTTTNPELSYRLQRVLEKLEDYTGPIVGNFDELTLKTGKVIRVDAGEFRLQGVLLDQKKTFDRKNLRQIVTHVDTETKTNRRTLQIATYNHPFPTFYKLEDKLVGFENLKSGESVPILENANEMFVFEGLKFQTEDAGYVGTIWYPFKLCLVEPGKKSICPFDETQRVAKRLWGTTLITFCLPDQPSVSAGVKKFGVFLERIDHSRDVVVEAYNAVGQMIGMVEATDQKCVFAGFESNELITCVRILKNPDLPELSRDIDNSYAIDNVTYAGLQRTQTLYDPVPGLADSRQVKLGLKNGDVLNVSNLSINDSLLKFDSSIFSDQQHCAIDDVRSLNYLRSRRFAASENDYLMVQLADSSIVKTEIDDWKQPFDFLDSQIREDQILGIWSGRHSARMPESKDFEANKPVIVYPGCRIIADDCELKPGGFFWNKDSSDKRIQNVLLFDQEGSRVTLEEEAVDPDLTPDTNQVAFRTSSQIPSLWLKEPTTIASPDGYVFLTDGQYFVLGSESGFKVTRMGSKNVEIEFGKSRKLYPLTRISSIKLPSN